MYVATGCVVSRDHVELRCNAAPGVGERHNFTVWIGGQQSPWTRLDDFHYQRPLLATLTIDSSSAIQVDSDAAFDYGTAPLGSAVDDAALPSTRLRAEGGSAVLLGGRYFGPAGDGHAVVGVFAPPEAFAAAGSSV